MITTYLIVCSRELNLRGALYYLIGVKFILFVILFVLNKQYD